MPREKRIMTLSNVGIQTPAGLPQAEQRAVVMSWWEKFAVGAANRGVELETAARIFAKFNGQYMFPESHAFAFDAGG